MRASSSPAPCGPAGPRADGGGPGWGWPKMLAVIGDSGSLGRYGAHAARPGAGRQGFAAVVGTSGHPLPTLPHQLASLAARRGRARKKEWPALKSPPLANRRFALRRGREMLEMRAYSSPAPCGPEGPRADGGGPGWGWPLTKKGRPEGRPKFWEETPNGRRVARRDRDNAVHNIGVIPPGFKKDFPFLLRRIICRRVLLLRCNIPTKIRHISALKGGGSA